MNTVESLGYLKGLLNGLGIDDDKKEAKVFKAIVEVLENIIDDVDDVYEEIDAIEEQVDAIDEDLADVEAFLSARRKRTRTRCRTCPPRRAP